MHLAIALIFLAAVLLIGASRSSSPFGSSDGDPLSWIDTLESIDAVDEDD